MTATTLQERAANFVREMNRRTDVGSSTRDDDVQALVRLLQEVDQQVRSEIRPIDTTITVMLPVLPAPLKLRHGPLLINIEHWSDGVVVARLPAAALSSQADTQAQAMAGLAQDIADTVLDLTQGAHKDAPLGGAMLDCWRALSALIEAPGLDGRDRSRSPSEARPTLPPGPPVWGYAIDEHPDTWSGECASREEAIAEGTRGLQAQRAACGDEPLTEFWIMSGSHPDPAMSMPDVERILDDMNAYALDNWGDVAEDFPAVSDEAQTELAGLFKTWARKHASPHCWIAQGPAERIVLGSAT
jgi:hypothetical protein